MPDAWPSLEVKTNQVAMFGYGSLLCLESMELTLGRSYDAFPIVCKLDGWHRSWDVMMPNTTFYEPSESGDFIPQNIIYLNIREHEGSSVNGLLYLLEIDELEAFDRREWIYDRRNVTSALQNVNVCSGVVYTYVGKPEWLVEDKRPRNWAAIRRSYLNLVDKGLTDLGSTFRGEYEASTDRVRADLVFEDRKRSGSHPLLAESQQQKNERP